MDNKYIVNKNENGKILWISIENFNGEVEIKKIKNIDNNTEYMEQLRNINARYDDFFNKFFAGEYTIEKEKYFEKITKQEQKRQNKEERKTIKEKTKINKSLAKRVSALGMAAVLAVTTIGYGLVKNTNLSKASYAKERNINEENSRLNKIYEELLKTENGEIIVRELKETDRWQRAYNDKIAKYKDKDGNVLFLKAREVSAVQDISNAENTDFISLDYDETRFCDYLSAGAVTHKGLYVSEESTGEYELIHDKNTKNEMKNEEDFALAAIKGKKTTKEINKHFDELMETGLTYTASGVNVAYLGEGSNIVISDEGRSSKKLAEFIEKVKTNNNGANKLDSYAKSKDVTKEERKLIDKAWKEMDKQNINVDLKSRDDFEMATTKKGLEKATKIGVKVNGGTLINSGGTYTYVTTTGKTIKVSRSEAIKRFGSSAVKKAEEKADSNVKVDTDGDGKKDTGMDEANKQEEDKKDQLEEEARNYERDYAEGQADGYAGAAKAKNTPGYNAGYANGQKQREAENEPDEIIEKKEEYTSNPAEDKTTRQPEEKSVESTEATPRQKVVEIETYEKNNENIMEMTMEDGISYTSSTKVRVRS